MGILLDFKPRSELEFFQIVMRIIKEENLFEDSIDPADIALENLNFFITKYDCFWRHHVLYKSGSIENYHF